MHLVVLDKLHINLNVILNDGTVIYNKSHFF